LHNPQSYTSHFCNLYSGKNQKDIVLVFPGKLKAPDPQVPLSLLHIASSLKQEPFPSPVMKYLPSEYTPPQSLEEWGGIEVFQFSPPWHSKKQIEKLHAISAVARCAFYPKSRIKDRALAFRFAYGLLNRVARYRWQQRYFGFPVELKIADAVARKFKGFL
jgi:hypothetical protein